MKTALVAGATGLVGKQLMYKLLENNQFEKVIVLTRKLFEIKHPKLVQILTNFDQLEQIDENIIPNDVFCCLGTTISTAGSQEAFYKVDFTYPKILAEVFKKRGATNFILISAIGASADSSVFYSRTKGEVEQAIKQLDYQGFYAFRPSFLLGKRQEFRLGERLAIGLSMLVQPFLFGSLAKYKPVHAAVLANHMIKRALESKIGNFVFESPDF
jgi:uncharacterized protein YbjT (DUF2867 family)